LERETGGQIEGFRSQRDFCHGLLVQRRLSEPSPPSSPAAKHSFGSAPTDALGYRSLGGSGSNGKGFGIGASPERSASFWTTSRASEKAPLCPHATPPPFPRGSTKRIAHATPDGHPPPQRHDDERRLQPGRLSPRRPRRGPPPASLGSRSMRLGGRAAPLGVAGGRFYKRPLRYRAPESGVARNSLAGPEMHLRSEFCSASLSSPW
jgi:hypothetical protein